MSQTRREFLSRTATASGFGLLGARTGDVRTTSQSGTAFQGTKPGQERDLEGIRLCWCPPGEFVMGSPPGETGRRSDEGQTRVTLTRGFWMGKFEVTQRQWQNRGPAPERPLAIEYGLGDEFPIYWINFFAAEAFCRTVSIEAVRSRAMPAGWECRIPTEAQWEYACRAGTTTATSFGAQLGRHQANFGGEPLNGGRSGTAPRRSTPVGSYPANPWGICDMHGNVFEWCRDWYHPRLPGGADPDLSDEQGTPNRDGSYSRVRRGGAWNDDGEQCRSAYRLRYEPERSSDHIGLRVAVVQT